MEHVDLEGDQREPRPEARTERREEQGAETGLPAEEPELAAGHKTAHGP